LPGARPLCARRGVGGGPSDWLFNGIMRPAWAYRLELALIALVATAYLWLGDRVGRQGGERRIIAPPLPLAGRPSGSPGCRAANRGRRLPGGDGHLDQGAARACPVPVPPATTL